MNHHLVWPRQDNTENRNGAVFCHHKMGVIIGNGKQVVTKFDEVGVLLQPRLGDILVANRGRYACIHSVLVKRVKAVMNRNGAARLNPGAKAAARKNAQQGS